jgi:hypothetical protein
MTIHIIPFFSVRNDGYPLINLHVLDIIRKPSIRAIQQWYSHVGSCSTHLPTLTTVSTYWIPIKLNRYAVGNHTCYPYHWIAIFKCFPMVLFTWACHAMLVTEYTRTVIKPVRHCTMGIHVYPRVVPHEICTIT